MEEEDGTTEGPCPFIVHGLTGEEFSTKTMKTIKAIALKHLTSEGNILAIGHAETPESIYGNPQLFPSNPPFHQFPLNKNIYFNLEELCHWSSDMKLVLASRFLLINLKFNG